MFHAVTRQLAALFTVGLLALLTGAAPAAAEQPKPITGPAIWRVSDEDSTLWIFGSFHLLDPKLKWRRPKVDAALKDADIVYFEASLDLLAQARISVLLIGIGFNPPGVNLTDSLTPDESRKFAEIVKKLGLRMADVDRMKPWLAGAVIGAQMHVNTGADPKAGVDAILELDARRAGKEIRFFETAEQQIRFLADLPHKDQVAGLRAAINEFERAEDLPDLMVKAWLAGDVAALSEQLELSFTGAPTSYYDRLLTQRNKRWAVELDKFMAGSGKALVVVGAGHMAGRDSLIGMLRARGYRIERF
ncbi:MAG: TraB/GumN family protein [Neomegalonema sp.]|nr:TraB/GumN family protein [Neomegalonema sp.]